MWSGREQYGLPNISGLATRLAARPLLAVQNLSSLDTQLTIPAVEAACRGSRVRLGGVWGTTTEQKPLMIRDYFQAVTSSSAVPE